MADEKSAVQLRTSAVENDNGTLYATFEFTDGKEEPTQYLFCRFAVEDRSPLLRELARAGLLHAAHAIREQMHRIDTHDA